MVSKTKITMSILVFATVIFGAQALASSPVDSTIVGEASGMCLDVPNATHTAGVQLQQWYCLGNPNQNFQFTQTSDGSYQIMNVNSGLCLDAGAASSAGPIVQSACSNASKWLALPDSSYGAGYYILEVSGTQMCLNVNENSLVDGGLMIAYACSNSAGNEAFKVQGITSSQLPASSNGTTIPSASQLVDSQSHVWTVVNGIILENGADAGTTSNVILLLYYNGVIYQENKYLAWWSWNGTAWVATSDPRVSVSADGTTIPSASQLVDSQSHVWTVVNGIILENGADAGTTSNVILLLYYNGVIYQENKYLAWWSWNGTAWVATSDPRVSVSADGTTIPSASQIVDSQGDVWTLSAGVVYENGATAGYTANVTEVLYYNGSIYSKNSSNTWYLWNGSYYWPGTPNPLSSAVASNPPPPPPPTSASGTTIPSASQLVDSQGHIWTVVNGIILENGANAGTTSNVILLIYYNGVIYQENKYLAWWSWNGTAWVATSDPRVVAAAPPPAVNSVFFRGMNTHLEGYGSSDTTTAFSMMSTLNVNSVRNTIRWDIVEQNVGQYTFPAQFDTIVNDSVANGMRPLLVLTNANPLYDGGALPTSATATAAYAKFAGAVAQHYKGKGVLYEIWNEWDGAGGTPQGYMNILTPAYTAIKQADPSAIVLGGSLTMDYPSFLGDLMSLHITQHCDGIAIHPYVQCGSNPTATAYESNVLGAETTIKNQNSGVLFPLYVTEIGWPTQNAGDGCGATTQANQATYLSQAIAMSPSDLSLKGIWVYDLRNDGTDPTYDQENFGIMNANWSQKPAFIDVEDAFKLLMQTLGSP